MSTRILLILGFSLATLHAADPSPEDLLRQGLFEEEANQNLDKAAEHYRAVITAHDRQRALAASATFRLGEVARKKNDKETAAAAFRAVTERFPEQAELARLSRENLAAFGINTATPSAPASTSTDPEDTEIARLKEIARNSPDLIDGADSDGYRPIHRAAIRGWTRVISYLLENKADPNGVTIKERFTPLHLASVHGHLGTVKALLAGKADPDITLGFSQSAIDNLPAKDGRLEHAKGSWTALDLAIAYDRREIALALIEAGTNIKRVGPIASAQISGYTDGFNTLMLAIYLKRNSLAQALIDAGAPLTAIGKKEPITPLGVALRENKSMVAPLLKAGADPNQPEYAERISPLHGHGTIDIVKLLVEAGANVKATTSTGETPLHWAYADKAEFLISKGADVHAKDSSGLTPLDHVVARDYEYEDGNAEVIETLLKHGATVADPHALLRRTSAAILPFVGERLVYPKMHNPDAILLAGHGIQSFNPELAPGPTRNRRAPVPHQIDNRRTDIITLETRKYPASPQPSLAEVMRMAFSQRYQLRSIRILRRGANERFDIIRDWTESGENSLPTDWPVLEWGDIVEVRNSSVNRSDAPEIGDFTAMIPARNVTFRLAGLEFPKKITGEESFWLDRNSSDTLPSLLPPNIESLVDLSRFAIHRKGLSNPIILDFSKPTDTRFRMLDGDVVEMSWDIPKLNARFRDEHGNHLFSLNSRTGNGSFSGISLVNYLSGRDLAGPLDFSKICILRRAENWKPEMFDFKAWLEQLPPREKWEREALISSVPKLNPGDAVIVIDNHAADAEKIAAEIRTKAKEVAVAMMPPPTPGQRQGPASGRSGE